MIKEANIMPNSNKSFLKIFPKNNGNAVINKGKKAQWMAHIKATLTPKASQFIFKVLKLNGNFAKL